VIKNGDSLEAVYEEDNSYYEALQKDIEIRRLKLVYKNERIQ